MIITSTRRRAGTHFLGSSLEQHPELNWLAEILDQRFRWRDQYEWWLPTGMAFPRYLRKIDELCDDDRTKVVAFHYDHLKSYREPIKHAAQERSARTIILHRRNLLKRYCSFEMAQKTNVWSITHSEQGVVVNSTESRASEPPRDATLTIDLAELQRFVADENEALNRDREFWKGLTPTFEIAYEDLVADFGSTMAAALEFIGVSPLELSPQTIKQEHRALADVIDNYEEVADWARSNGRDGWL